jgi:Tol biopolymer transport system component
MKHFLTTLLMMGALAAGMNVAAILPAQALVEIDVNKGNVEPLPIAITDFLSGDAMGAEIAGIVAAGPACSRRSTRARSSKRSPTPTRPPASRTGR